MLSCNPQTAFSHMCCPFPGGREWCVLQGRWRHLLICLCGTQTERGPGCVRESEALHCVCVRERRFAVCVCVCVCVRDRDGGFAMCVLKCLLLVVCVCVVVCVSVCVCV